MKRLTKAVLLSLVALVLIVAPVLAVVYSAPLTVTENASIAYTMSPTITYVDNVWLVANGFMDATGRDTRVETLGGLEHPHLTCDNKTLFAIPIPADSQTNLFYTMGNTLLAAMRIIFGVGGYAMTLDDPILEPASNFSIELNGWVPPDFGDAYTLNFLTLNEVDPNGKLTMTATRATGVDVDRDEDAYLYKDMTAGYFDSLDVDFEIYIANTSLDSAAGGVAFTNTVGGVTTFAATDLSMRLARDPGPAYNFYLIRGNGVATDSGGGFAANTLYYCTSTRAAGNDSVDLEIYSNAARTVLLDTLTVAGFGAVTWQYVYGFLNRNTGLAGADFDGYVQNLTLNGDNNALADLFIKGGAIFASVNEAREITAAIVGGATVTTAAVTAAAHDIAVTADSVNLTIYVDGANAGTVALGGVPVPGTDNDWYWLMNNAMPYANNITMSVGGTPRLWYEPNAIVLTTVLPDREGVAQNGAITWGANPTGVGAVLSSLVAETQPAIGTDAVTPTRDLLPEAGSSDWSGDGTVTKDSTLASPVRPFVTMVSDNTALSEIQVWRWLGAMAWLFVVVWSAKKLRGHLGITSIMAGVAIGGLVAFDHNIFPLYLLVLTIVMVTAGVVAERSPSL